MSYALVFDFAVTTQEPAIYWWPLLLEVLGTNGFQFADPSLPQRVSGYTYTRQEEMGVSGVGSFQQFWQELFTGVDVMTAVFWDQEKDQETSPFTLEVTVSQDQAGTTSHISLDMPGAVVMQEARGTVRQRLQRVVACAKGFYEVCFPAHGTSYWTTPGLDTTPWATFGSPPSEPFSVPDAGFTPTLTLMRQPLSHGQWLYFFHPVPFAHSRHWEFVSGFDERAEPSS